MTPNDLRWFEACKDADLVRSPLLEVGAAKVQGSSNLCEIARLSGVSQTVGTDLVKMAGVDEVLDFGRPATEFAENYRLGTFKTVCIFNVLEHTFDPLTVLSNALTCVTEGGALLVVAPSIWPIHNFPGDFTRLLPDWYREFSRRNRLQLKPELFCWLSEFGIETIGPSAPDFPTFLSRKGSASRTRYWLSRLGHRALNTYGRSHSLTYAAIGAAFVRQ